MYVKYIIEPCGLTPVAEGNILESQTYKLSYPNTLPCEFAAHNYLFSPIGQEENKCTVNKFDFFGFITLGKVFKSSLE